MLGFRYSRKDRFGGGGGIIEFLSVMNYGEGSLEL